MALADWEIIKGGGLSLTTRVAYSGSKSLAGSADYPQTHIVHTATYNDAPKNAYIDTFVCTPINDAGAVYYPIVGAVFRKQPNVKTYYYIYIEIELDNEGYIYNVYAYLRKVVYGDETLIKSATITDNFTETIPRIHNLAWFMSRFEMIEGGDSLTFNVYITPENPSDPENQLNIIWRVTENPISIKEGGAIGLVVGGSYDAWGNAIETYYDLTKIYY